MKKHMIVMVLLVAGAAHADWTYGPYGPGSNFGTKTLYESESILVNGGEGIRINSYDHSYVRIESTSPLKPGDEDGGIRVIGAFGQSMIDVFGGDIRFLDIYTDAHVSLYGGQIAYIYSNQVVSIPSGKHIDVFCKSHSFNNVTGMLTGLWGDDSSFNISLWSPSGYTPAIDNINFVIIPEPLSLSLLSVGSLLMRRHKPM